MRHTIYTMTAALWGCVTLWAATDGFQAITAEGARRVQIAKNPEPVPSIQLETMNGDWHDLQRRNVPMLVEFIYTTCPTICQTSGGDFAELRDHLHEDGIDVPMYSISFDPETDTLDMLQTYAESHSATGKPWTIARPRQEDVSTLLDVFRVTVIPDGWGGYTHNLAVLLINDQGKFAGVFDTREFGKIQSALEAIL